MLKLTKKADYGLIAMRHLAESSGEAYSAKDLAEAYGIPQEALAKILQRLAKNGLLLSHHGVNGGYVLAREARKISVFDVIQAIEGPLLVTSCHTPTRGECEQSPRCNIREPLRRIGESIQGVLMRLSIADMRSGELSEADSNGHKAAREFVTLA
jgi:FeS assembly SUF system regulator